jgi:polyphosphate kinase
VETLTPVIEPVLQDRLREILAVMLSDDRRAWTLGPDATWRRVESITDEPQGIDTFTTLMARARAGSPAGG